MIIETESRLYCNQKVIQWDYWWWWSQSAISGVDTTELAYFMLFPSIAWKEVQTIRFVYSLDIFGSYTNHRCSLHPISGFNQVYHSCPFRHCLITFGAVWFKMHNFVQTWISCSGMGIPWQTLVRQVLLHRCCLWISQVIHACPCLLGDCAPLKREAFGFHTRVWESLFIVFYAIPLSIYIYF